MYFNVVISDCQKQSLFDIESAAKSLRRGQFVLFTNDSIWSDARLIFNLAIARLLYYN